MLQSIYTTASTATLNLVENHSTLRNEPFSGALQALVEANNILGSMLANQESNWLISGVATKWNLKIDILGNEDYVLKRPIPIIISEKDDEYVAEFPEAEIVTSGETADEALRWLKGTIVDTFELFRTERNILGPLPRKQLRVLEGYLGKKSDRKG